MKNIFNALERRKLTGLLRRGSVVVASFVLVSVGFAEESECASVVRKVQEQCAAFVDQVRDITLLQEMRAEHSVTDQVVLQKGLKTRVETRRHSEEAGLGLAGDAPTSFEMLEIFDGLAGWRMLGEGPVEKISLSEVENYSATHSCWGFDPEQAAKGDPKRVPDRECCAVAFDDDGAHYELMLCAKRLVILEGARTDSSGDVLRWVHSDFNKVYGDFLYPFKTEVFVNGELASTSGVLHFKVNSGLSDDLFDIEKIREERGLAPGSVEHGTTIREKD